MSRLASYRVTPEDRQRLQALVTAPLTPQQYVWHCTIVLATAEGWGTMEIMCRTGKVTVCRWQDCRWRAYCTNARGRRGGLPHPSQVQAPHKTPFRTHGTGRDRSIFGNHRRMLCSATNPACSLRLGFPPLSVNPGRFPRRSNNRTHVADIQHRNLLVALENLDRASVRHTAEQLLLHLSANNFVFGKGAWYVG